MDERLRRVIHDVYYDDDRSRNLPEIMRDCNGTKVENEIINTRLRALYARERDI